MFVDVFNEVGDGLVGVPFVMEAVVVGNQVSFCDLVPVAKHLFKDGSGCQVDPSVWACLSCQEGFMQGLLLRFLSLHALPVC